MVGADGGRHDGAARAGKTKALKLRIIRLDILPSGMTGRLRSKSSMAVVKWRPDKASQPDLATDAEQAGPVIADLIGKELDTERSVMASLQARGLAVISSAGTLVTLLFGLSALAMKAEQFRLPPGTRLPLYTATALLVGAAVAGIVTNAPRGAGRANLSDLSDHLDSPYWEYPAAQAQREVARSQLRSAQSMRKSNRFRARFLLGAIVLEIAGIACVMWAAIALIAHR